MKHQPAGAFCVEPRLHARLETFVDLLLHWNRRVNLIARPDEDRIWERHVCDSAQLAELLPPTPGSLMDLGSGGGFPGLVLALITERPTHLVEADQRKAAFLREAIRATAATAIVHATRIETLTASPVDVVTARSLGTVSGLLALAAPHLIPQGVCIFPKGRSYANELTTAAREWQMRVERFPSRTDASATLLRLSEITRAAPG